MSKDGLQVSKCRELLITAVAFLASFMGFGWLLLSLHHEGLKTRTERLYYLPYQLGQAERQIQEQARVPIKLQTSEIEPGVYEHTLKIQSSMGERITQISEMGLELSAPSEWSLISADVTFQGNEGIEKTPDFATAERKKLGTKSSILLRAMPGAQKANAGLERGLLRIKSAGGRDLSVWVQKSKGKPVSEILWTLLLNTEGDPVYASLSGWFRYSEEAVPNYSKAQLLAHAWGMGVSGNRVIYVLVGIAFLLWISGMGLLLVPDLIAKVIPRFLTEAIGCSLIFGSICLIFSFIFPTFHGPDETNHFFTYTKITGKESIEKGALELANKGCFQRIHRRADNKFVSRDALEIRNEEWPHYGSHHYPLDRSPLERVCWKKLGKIMPHENAASVMLQLRIINGLFVALCLLLALAVAGSIFPMRHLAPWFSAPVLFIPCIAHYSTVVSNYPFLIGGYVIQMVVLGILWASMDSSKNSNRNLAKTGALLGLGIGIALSSADNAMVTLPFWGVILPVWLLARRHSDELQPTGMKDSVVLLGSMLGTLILFCIALAPVSINHSFLPGMTSTKLAQLLPVSGSQFFAGIGLVVSYSAALFAFTSLVCMVGPKIWKLSWRIPWRTAGFVVLAIITITLMLWKAPPVPEIDLSRGGNTTAIKYAFVAVGSFADGLFPGQADGMICGSFWRKLGWLETDLPAGLMEVLRNATGLGFILLMFASLRETSVKGMGVFSVANILALVACLMAIGVLYYTVLYNVNSRYILVAYLIAAMLASEGYRRFLSESHATKSHFSIASSCICIVAMGIQSWSWITILNRYL